MARLVRYRTASGAARAGGPAYLSVNTRLTLGQVENVEPGDYSFPPSISLYNPTADERATVVDKEGGSHRYEVKENFTGKVTIEEYPPEAGEGTPLVLKSGGTLDLHFHPVPTSITPSRSSAMTTSSISRPWRNRGKKSYGIRSRFHEGRIFHQSLGLFAWYFRQL